MNTTVLMRTMRLTIVGLIAITGLFGLVLGYQGLLGAVSGDPTTAAARLPAALILCGGCYLLARYRNDLVDD